MHDDAHNDPWPTTLDAAVDRLLAILRPDQLDEIRTASSMIDFHLGLGMWIRNNFGLWQGNDALMRSIAGARGLGSGWLHPDSASTCILEALQAHLRSRRDAFN